jgi:ATP-binding cassette subfamily B protein
VAQRSEFTVQDAYAYDQRSVLRWTLSHALRYWPFLLVALAGFLTSWTVYPRVQVLIGQAVADVLSPQGANLLGAALAILALLVADGIGLLVGSFAAENVASRFEADARQELYASLLGKSKTFHDRQRVGDIMARATDDTSQLSNMIVPGSTLILETVLGIIMPLFYIGTVNTQLLLVPLLFVAGYIVAARRYMGRLGPVIRSQRDQFGAMNAGLEETVSGIEVVKASARELFERGRFRRNARLFRDLYVRQGRIEARYLPLLLYGFAMGGTFLHATILYRQGAVGIGDVIATMGLMNILRFPTFISIFAFSTIQQGRAAAERILQIIRAETDLDENQGGHAATLRGAIEFRGVSFGYERAGSGERGAENAVLRDISFRIEPGQTVAIVGQTGSGKSALTQLVNRTYDATAGEVLIDGVDVRDWNLDSLRSQISKIEQDIFLFARSIADNIAFGAPGATRPQIEDAATAAQAHEFITGFPQGYETVVGERGVTLSGGQRQRIALARAFLSDPRILILDDSTSAIDSATEDQIQRALRKAQEGRTTLLITHRLSQIRWADQILVLDGGRVVARGDHEALLRTSPHYRRIFARYELELPPLEEDLEVALR